MSRALKKKRLMPSLTTVGREAMFRAQPGWKRAATMQRNFHCRNEKRFLDGPGEAMPDGKTIFQAAWSYGGYLTRNCEGLSERASFCDIIKKLRRAEVSRKSSAVVLSHKLIRKSKGF
ncbi:hypothetical protein KCP70_17625 [Salmonella enterica subsp. enterica]|nr:hypothetical protein KCP70_17625 [Salmonella enterica subsp. enterica]